MPWTTGTVPRPAPEADSKALRGETWTARVSEHENDARDGIATFEELVEACKREHAKHEQEYTPNLYDSHKVLEWDIDEAADVGPFHAVEMGSTFSNPPSPKP